MKNFKRLATSLVALFFVVAFSSCEKQQAKNSTIDVSFDIADLTNGLDKKGAMEEGDPNTTNVEQYPTCTDLETDYVVVTIDGVSYTLQMTALPNSQTEVVQLDADAPNLVTSLVVFSNEQTDPIYIAPENTSAEVTQGGLVGVPFDITTKAWDKASIHVDVVCWHPYSHRNYAWNWFQIDYKQVKTICFFGDVCTKFYKDFGATGYDLQADFTVDLTYENSQGVMVTNTVTTQNDDGNYVNEDGPLCVSYIDDINKEENATYDLTLHTPTGDILLADNVAVAEGTWSEIGKTDGFGGDDGVYLFNVGNCGIDEEGQFPSYLPLPNTAKMRVGVFSPDSYNITITQDNDPLRMLSDITNEQAWCLDKNVAIYEDVEYTGRVFSSLDIAKLMADPTITPARKTRFQNLPWGVINYMINHLDELPTGTSPADLQHAFWYITDAYANANQADKDKIDQWLSDYATWTPSVGQDAVVFLIPDQADGPVQAFGVRIDP